MAEQKECTKHGHYADDICPGCLRDAAPDLLEACEGLMEKADNGSADFDDPVPGSIYLKAKAAIAKATRKA